MELITEQQVETASPVPPRLLVVDDEPDNLELLCRLFQRHGCEVFPAVNGTDALRLAGELKPDLLLLDVMLPDVNGREVCRSIKSNPALVDVFIALISSIEISPDSKVAGLECGADEYITRPIANKELVARVDALIRIQRALKARRLAEARLAQLNQTLEQRVLERTAELAFANELLRAEMAARKASEERFTAFMEHTPVYAWIKDERFRYVYMNPRARRFLKLSPEHACAQTDFALFPRSHARQIRLHDQAALERGTSIEVMEDVTDSAKEARHIWVLRFPLQDAEGRRFLGGMAVDITEKVRAEEALRALPHRILAAQEGERRRVARELHDGVSQLLASVRFRLLAVEGWLHDRADDTLRREVTRAKSYLASALREVRDISHNLRPRELDDLGLVAAIHSAAEEIAERSNLRVACRLARLRNRLPLEVELALYRIFQEAVANILKHAEAKRITVELAREERGVVLRVADNGCGFAAARKRTSASHSSLGLVNMRERAEFIGGTLTVKSVPREGTTIEVWAPLSRTRRKAGQT
jgi:PAS domain S-box-containing protein